MSTELLIGLVGIASSSISSFITWALAKKKYDAEVDSAEIQNLKDSLDFYKHVLEENEKLLKSYIKKVDENIIEIHKLRNVIQELLSLSCVDAMCKKRKLISMEELKKMLGEDAE